MHMKTCRTFCHEIPPDGDREPGVERGSDDPAGGAPRRQAGSDGLQQARHGQVGAQ